MVETTMIGVIIFIVLNHNSEFTMLQIKKINILFYELNFIQKSANRKLFFLHIFDCTLK